MKKIILLFLVANLATGCKLKHEIFKEKADDKSVVESQSTASLNKNNLEKTLSTLQANYAGIELYTIFNKNLLEHDDENLITKAKAKSDETIKFYKSLKDDKVSYNFDLKNLVDKVEKAKLKKESTWGEITSDLKNRIKIEKIILPVKNFIEEAGKIVDVQAKADAAKAYSDAILKTKEEKEKAKTAADEAAKTEAAKLVADATKAEKAAEKAAMKKYFVFKPNEIKDLYKEKKKDLIAIDESNDFTCKSIKDIKAKFDKIKSIKEKQAVVDAIKGLLKLRSDITRDELDVVNSALDSWIGE